MPAALSDFSTDSGVAADPVLLPEPQWSLYSLDLTGNLAIFGRLPPGTDLSVAAFIPQVRFDTAESILTVPLDALPTLSDRLPRPARPIFLFSIARCGPTLANHILSTVPDTFARSEPGAFVTLAMARQDMQPDRAPLTELAATLDVTAPQTPHAPLPATGRAHNLSCYQNLVAEGLPCLPLRCDDLAATRERNTRALRSHCGLSASTLTQASASFDRASQEGSAISREAKATGRDEAAHASLVNTLARTPQREPSDIRL